MEDDLFDDGNQMLQLERDTLVVDLDGFEGPLDLLLSLARTQRMDLAKISILDLSRQYLDFIEEAKSLRLDLAADYLVMAAWLAYLKSRLLLPPEDVEEDEPNGAELAAALAFRLKRLAAMRQAAGQIMERPRLGLDIFSRGNPEGIRVIRENIYQASTYDLLNAYAGLRLRTSITSVAIKRRPVWSIKRARVQLEKLLGATSDWAALDGYLVQYLAKPGEGRSAMASTLGASLEMARDGALHIRQDAPFSTVYIKSRGDNERAD